MLLLAHLSREEVAPPLRKDLAFLLAKGLPLLQEMLALSTMPRVQVGRGPRACCVVLVSGAAGVGVWGGGMGQRGWKVGGAVGALC